MLSRTLQLSSIADDHLASSSLLFDSGGSDSEALLLSDGMEGPVGVFLSSELIVIDDSNVGIVDSCTHDRRHHLREILGEGGTEDLERDQRSIWEETTLYLADSGPAGDEVAALGIIGGESLHRRTEGTHYLEREGGLRD